MKLRENRGEVDRSPRRHCALLLPSLFLSPSFLVLSLALLAHRGMAQRMAKESQQQRMRRLNSLRHRARLFFPPLGPSPSLLLKHVGAMRVVRLLDPRSPSAVSRSASRQAARLALLTPLRFPLLLSAVERYPHDEPINDQVDVRRARRQRYSLVRFARPTRCNLNFSLPFSLFFFSLFLATAQSCREWRRAAHTLAHLGVGARAIGPDRSPAVAWGSCLDLISLCSAGSRGPRKGRRREPVFSLLSLLFRADPPSLFSLSLLPSSGSTSAEETLRREQRERSAAGRATRSGRVRVSAGGR